MNHDKEESHEEIIRFTNCWLCSGRNKLAKNDLWVQNGRILDKHKTFFKEKATYVKIIDCRGNILAPGFIDIQINGSIGVDFSDLSKPSEYVARILKVKNHLLKFGVTTFYPTIITSSPEIYRKIAAIVAENREHLIENGILGFHYEGPFISKTYAGAHRKDWLKTAKTFEDLIEVYGSLDFVSMITLAPECVTLNIIAELTARKIKVSIGHTNCTYEEADEAVKSGANCITHLFSCMRPMHHRDPGPVGCITNDQLIGNHVYFGMITDGVHMHNRAVKMAFRSDSERMIVVTDAASTAGLNPGVYEAHGQRVEVTEDRVFIAGTNTLAGSNANMAKCIKVLQSATGASIEAIISCATTNPAQCMDIIEQYGSLQTGSVANLIEISQELEIKRVFLKGEERCMESA